jgi:DNA processing protein
MKRSAAERQELAAHLALLAAPGLSPPAIVRVLIEQGSALAALRALPHECDADVARAIGSTGVRERVRRALAAIDAERIRTIALHDPLYPRRLADRLGEHAPSLLFARGRLEFLTATGVAVVGSRSATRYGLDIADEIACGVARAGGCVISGLALGVDAAAHRGALNAEGATIGVLGCGVDVYYPRRNLDLQDRVAREGLLLSELLPGMPPLKHHFKHRNRIIAALADAVVVVEAGERSGAVSTGTHGATLGIPVYGVMNAMHLPQVQGVLDLLRDGAFVYTGLRDLLEMTKLIELGGAVPQRELPLPAVPEHHRPVFGLLRDEPVPIDTLVRCTGLTPETVAIALLELELEGLVRALPGHRYSRVGPGSG